MCDATTVGNTENGLDVPFATAEDKTPLSAVRGGVALEEVFE